MGVSRYVAVKSASPPAFPLSGQATQDRRRMTVGIPRRSFHRHDKVTCRHTRVRRVYGHAGTAIDQAAFPEHLPFQQKPDRTPTRIHWPTIIVEVSTTPLPNSLCGGNPAPLAQTWTHQSAGAFSISQAVVRNRGNSTAKKKGKPLIRAQRSPNPSPSRPAKARRRTS